MGLGSRIKKLRQDKCLTQGQLGSVLNLAVSTICLYESDRRSPDYTTLKQLANYFNVTIDYLLGATNESISTPQKTDNNCFLNESLGLYESLNHPVIEDIKSGSDGLIYEYSESKNDFLDIKDQDSCFWVKIKNDSLKDEGILLGDFALIEKRVHPEDGKLHIVIIDNGLITIGRVYENGDAFVIHFANRNHPPLILSGKETAGLKILGKVIKILRAYN